jgi:hypothetical protein
MSKTYTTTVFEDENGELCIEIPIDLLDILNQMGWDEETLLDYRLQDDGSVILKKQNDQLNTE